MSLADQGSLLGSTDQCAHNFYPELMEVVTKCNPSVGARSIFPFTYVDRNRKPIAPHLLQPLRDAEASKAEGQMTQAKQKLLCFTKLYGGDEMLFTISKAKGQAQKRAARLNLDQLWQKVIEGDEVEINKQYIEWKNAKEKVAWLEELTGLVTEQQQLLGRV